MQQCCFSDRCVICLTDQLWGAQWDLRCMISSHCHNYSSFSIITLDGVAHDFAVGTRILPGPHELDMQERVSSRPNL